MPRIITLLLCLALSGPLTASDKAASIAWRDWSDAAFAEAQREHKLLILDLEAVWCHWCHVMDEKTYSDPKVIALLKRHYIALRVDQDNRPDLARRYQAWGWPATILFDANGVELVKRAGYIEPAGMARLLQALVDDPTPEPDAPLNAVSQFAGSALLGDALRRELQRRHLDSYDTEYGGLRLGQKFLDRDTVEYAMLQARRGDRQNTRIARHTLDAAMGLLDPAWGGAYQYSTGGKWDYPHFEKIMQVQAGYLRAYALAALQFREPRYRHAAESIATYLQQFLLSPEGAFYTSQDADLVQGQHSRAYFALPDQARRAQGIPRIDTHRYAQENGWAAEALTVLYAASGDPRHLATARRALDWALQERTLPGGGFRHDAVDKGGPFLGDSLAMSSALLALYEVTGERAYLQQAAQAMQFIDRTFRYAADSGAGNAAGYAVAYAPPGAVLKPQPQIDENIALARTAIRLQHYTGELRYRAIAERAMRYLATPAIANSRLTEAGILLVEQELGNDPVHITIVGHKDDTQAQALFAEALRYPGSYRRIEWWDKREGAMPNPDVQYPSLPRAAAFACSNRRCSLPVFAADAIHDMVDSLNGVHAAQQPAGITRLQKP